jgi:fermentation-respiration switch protein FrsA (DUF1100 family)
MKRIGLLFLIFGLHSCLKLDSNLYNNTDQIDSYKLDNYSGEQDFILDGTYAISVDHVKLFTLESKTANEKNATKIQALYIGDETKISTDTVILYCHGNKWHMDFYWQRAKLLAHVNGKNKYGVMMMDYRGFGLSEGNPTEEGMYADVDACLNWLKEKGLSADRLIIYGFSLGSAPACELSAKERSLKPSKLILEAPFGSSAIMVQDGAQLSMPASYFTDVKVDNAEEIKKVWQDLLWIHGDEDNFLNYKTHGEVVFKNHAGAYKEKFIVHGADHGEVPAKMGFEKYLEVLGAFIRKQ